LLQRLRRLFGRRRQTFKLGAFEVEEHEMKDIGKLFL
jgi:hypothetical protein